MQIDYQRSISGPGSGRPLSLLTKVVRGIAVAAVLAVAVAFSIVLFVIALAVLLGFGGYLWWKTRALRSQMHTQMRAWQAGATAEPAGNQDTVRKGETIEGEVIEKKPISEAQRVDTNR